MNNQNSVSDFMRNIFICNYFIIISLWAPSPPAQLKYINDVHLNKKLAFFVTSMLLNNPHNARYTFCNVVKLEKYV